MNHFLKLSYPLWLLIFAVPSFAKSWQNVFPLHTTGAEVLYLFGNPKINLQNKSEYFVVDNQTVTFRWTQAHCLGEDSIIDEKLVRQDSLVYQVSVKPDAPLQSIDLYTADIPEIHASIPGFYLSPYATNCLINTAGQISCSYVSNEYGFGYSDSNRGFTHLIFFPTSKGMEREAQTLFVNRK